MAVLRRLVLSRRWQSLLCFTWHTHTQTDTRTRFVYAHTNSLRTAERTAVHWFAQWHSKLETLKKKTVTWSEITASLPGGHLFILFFVDPCRSYILFLVLTSGVPWRCETSDISSFLHYLTCFFDVCRQLLERIETVVPSVAFWLKPAAASAFVNPVLHYSLLGLALVFNYSSFYWLRYDRSRGICLKEHLTDFSTFTALVK